MRLLFVNQHPVDALGGSELQTVRLATALAARGHEVTYYAVNGNAASYDEPFTVIRGRLGIWHLWQVLRDIQPEVIYWRYNRNRYLRVAVLAALRRVPVIFAVSNRFDVRCLAERRDTRGLALSQRWASARRRLWAPVSYQGLRLAAALTTMTSEFLNQAPVSRQAVVPNSAGGPAVPFAWPRPYCVWVSNLKRHKRPELFVSAAAKLVADGVDFLMVGRIADSAYEDLPSSTVPNFHFLGPKSPAEVAGIIADSLCVVHTCRPEGFPNVYIEAWSQGVPVVTLEYDPGDIINREQVGYVSGTVEAMAREIRELRDETVSTEAMRARARSLADREFSLQRSASTLEDLMFEVCSHGA